MKRLLVLLVALAGLAAVPRADDARPAYLELREVQTDLYDVTWRTPMRAGARLRMAPRFPVGTRVVDGFYDVRLLSDALIEEWRIDVPGGLSGRELRVDGALGVRDAIVRVRFLDGRRESGLLTGGRATFVVPAAPEDPFTTWPATLRAGVIGGARHALAHPAHWFLALAVGLAAAGSTLGWALGAFLVAQWLGLFGVALSGDTLPAPIGEAAASVVAALAARLALDRSTRRLVVLAAWAGLVHGATQPAGVPPIEGAAAALGLDVVHLAIAGVAAAVGPALRERWRSSGLYAIGSVAVAVALVGIVRREDTGQEAPSLDGLPSLTTGADPFERNSQPPARGLTTPAALYLDVAPFETRLELLARWEVLRTWTGLEPPSVQVLPVDRQAAVLRGLTAGLRDRVTLRIDGVEQELVTTRLSGFTASDATGIYFRDEPIPEPLDQAVVGFVFALPTERIPGEVTVSVADLPRGLDELPVRISDPEQTVDERLAADGLEAGWSHALRDDPVPTIRQVIVRPPLLALPLVGLGVGLAGLFWIARGLLRTEARRFPAAARLLLAIACLLGPVGTVDVPGSWLRSSVPQPAEATALASSLLHNVYRAFDFREETEIYDRLAVSVSGDLLDRVYLEHRRGLEIERAGGARARVEAVEVTGVEDLTAAGDGFAGLFEWTVAGSVTHFGHRHVRQNRYRARLTLTASGDAWRIDGLELLDEERLR